MDSRSKHLSSEERGVIFAKQRRGSSQRAIDRLLGRPASRIGRELARGRPANGSYCHIAARRVNDERRARAPAGWRGALPPGPAALPPGYLGTKNGGGPGR
jgi:IS30 family transposase